MGTLSCSVVIPTLRRAGPLRQLLVSLIESDTPPREIIVVCDGPDPQTRQLAQAREFADVQSIFLEVNAGQSAARNRGVATATGDVLLFLDDDMIAAPNLVRAHTSHHEVTDGGPVVVCGQIIEQYPHPPDTVIETCLRARRHQILESARKAIRQGSLAARYYACCGANCSLLRATFVEFGGFDPALRTGMEDADLGLRLLDGAVRFIVDDTAAVYHHNQKDIRETFLTGNKDSAVTQVRQARRGRLADAHAKRLADAVYPSRGRAISEKVRRSSRPVYLALESGFERAVSASGSLAFARAWSTLAGSRAYIEGLEMEGETPESAARLIPAGPQVALFHSISSPPSLADRSLCFPPEKLRKLCRRLSLHGMPGPEATDGVTLFTFDDAYEDFYIAALPILRDFGFRCTVFVVASLIGSTNGWDESRGRRTRQLMNLAQLREISDLGIEIGSHSMTHAWLPSVEPADLWREVFDSKCLLEDSIGKRVRSFAYPSGGVGIRERLAVRAAGYDTAMTTIPGRNRPFDAFAVQRWEIHSGLRIDAIAKTVEGKRRHLEDKGLVARNRSRIRDGILRRLAVYGERGL